jgi:hypothetical protein
MHRWFPILCPEAAETPWQPPSQPSIEEDLPASHALLQLDFLMAEVAEILQAFRAEPSAPRH